ncbi:hypothetical protein ACFL3D_06765, partial [Candidatus Omnitrophota bacterium]
MKKKTGKQEQCPYYTESLDNCNIRYGQVRGDKGMQAHVCLTSRHQKCKFFKDKSNKTMLKILLVDDNLYEHEALYRSLQEYGQCELVITKEKALLAYMLAIKSKDYHDAIIINVQIPELDGIETIKKIRQFE